MLDGLAANLSAVFSGADAVVITDDPRMAAWLSASGVRVTTFEALSAGDAEVPAHAVIVPLDYDRLPSRRELRTLFAATSVLWVPLASFSSDFETAQYAVERFAEMDLARTVATNRRIITRLLLARDAVSLSGPDTALTIRLPDVLQLSSRTRLSLLHDEHSTVGNYFEVALSPTDLSGQVDTALSVSGTFRVDTLLVARHRELRGLIADDFSEAATLADAMRKACPLQVEVRDNRIVDGLGPWAEGIDALSGPEYRGAITEVAVGTGALPREHMDWSLNCLVNEGAAGIHIGVGNGLTGMHFDFISTEARLDGA
ncbi:hypothetical protein [Ralstonia pseudosolanacearum]|uniref:hypothetical protein n=1 Tax=Ralstonia pseudosolanacearum TaxID=1310165 RepID=UPI001FF72563|nr:hypothetical protein [Ralstonia pseudosolanacearum]